MKKQLSFSEIEFANKRKKTQKEVFFEKMRRIVPLVAWCDLIRPYYYEIGMGRQPILLETMLKMYLVSQWFNLSDAGAEDMLNENLAVRSYVGLDGDAPDETTLCKFRHLLEKNDLNKKIFVSFNQLLVEENIILKEGTIVDATIINAPTSYKNKTKQRTPEMGSTRKNDQKYYGLKAHIGVDEHSGIVHSVATTAANTSDIDAVNDVLHGDESVVRGDAAYVGIEKRVDICEKYQDGSGEIEWLTHSHKKPAYMVCKIDKNVKFEINKKRSTVTTDEQKALEKSKASVRIKVEHVFAVIKQRFGFRKTRYRNLAKNANKLLMLFTLANVLVYSRHKAKVK